MVGQDMRSVGVSEERIIVVPTSLCSGATLSHKAAWFNHFLAGITAWDQTSWLEDWEKVKTGRI